MKKLWNKLWEVLPYVWGVLFALVITGLLASVLVACMWFVCYVTEVIV